ncbi:hypothetical protein FB99_46790 (plasmid) [Pantoea agglomerans]|nr:hypothetical protein FB99_46790 [Pantoea agglomerans]
MISSVARNHTPAGKVVSDDSLHTKTHLKNIGNSVIIQPIIAKVNLTRILMTI